MARQRSSSRDPLTFWPEETRISTGLVRIEPDLDHPRSATLHVNGVPSSFINLDDPTDVGFEYLEVMLAVIAALPAGPLNVVHLGAAGCSLARAVHALRPQSRQIAVELDVELATLVRDWFDLPRAPQLRIRAGDARAELAKMHTASADVIIRDAFAPDTTPRHLTTAEFDAEIARVLKPGGLYLANIADRPPLNLTWQEAATVKSAFAQLDELIAIAEPAVVKGRRFGNIVLAATTFLAVTETQDPADGHRDTLSNATLDRKLRGLGVPMRILTESDMAPRTATAQILEDDVVGHTSL